MVYEAVIKGWRAWAVLAFLVAFTWCGVWGFIDLAKRAFS